MKNHNRGFEAEYFLFARKWRPLLMICLLAAICTANYFLSLSLWQAAILLGPILCFAVLIFMDYFVFSGFNSRTSIGMDLVKSSLKGRMIIKKALEQDIVNKTFFVLTGSASAFVFVLRNHPEVDLLFLIFFTIGGFSTTHILLHLILLIDRSKGLTMQAHVFICYLSYSLGTVIFLPAVFISETMSLLFMIIYSVVTTALGIFTGIILIRSCMKAYDSCFHDV